MLSWSATDQWTDLVESHVDDLWRFAIASGLPEPAATAACELAWLRLAQRWSPLGGIAEHKVRDWLEETILSEVRAHVRQAALV
jgi:hypothetical protein